MDIIDEMLDIRQPPTEKEPQAIVVATIRTDSGIRQGIGAAVGNRQEYNPHALLVEATRHAREMVITEHTSATSSQALAIAPKKSQFGQPPTPSSSQSMTHNTKAGSITDKQLSTIENMCNERNMSFIQLVEEKYNSQPQLLSSQQANELIQGMRKTTARR